MKIDPSLYGDRIADIYDEELARLPQHFDPADCVQFLSEFAGDGGRVLELGVGTGRVALPLAAQGLSVTGIDVSDEMLRKLREKPGADRMTIVQGSFVELARQFAPAAFDLVYAVVDTFLQLQTRDEQRQALAGVCEVLRPNGVFVVDAWVPSPARFTGANLIGVWRITPDEVVFEVAQHGGADRTVLTQQVILTNGSVRLNPMIHLETYPDELDSLAELTGLKLVERWGGWRREPFTPYAQRHISVYQR